ncbi:hypothetical protein Mlg_0251 [Alkalilimnicola ehrlichii MLHE-1]|uniref:Transposase IS200-like domain-containing protein n=2 Tax=Alkalilimnicola ehrlichii TaxID=351052 RepID=Q0AC31_ALKEH|nr:hypothetical protein Mlg_0251 [Alkalilimnicola ehrlichii MLHE-1]
MLSGSCRLCKAGVNAKGMRYLNGVYTQFVSRTHRRVGPVFQGRYKAILVEKGDYLLELARYVALNPVRAEMVNDAADWPWRSHRAMLGAVEVPDWLTCDRLRQQIYLGTEPAGYLPR